MTSTGIRGDPEAVLSAKGDQGFPEMRTAIHGLEAKISFFLGGGGCNNANEDCWHLGFLKWSKNLILNERVQKIISRRSGTFLIIFYRLEFLNSSEAFEAILFWNDGGYNWKSRSLFHLIQRCKIIYILWRLFIVEDTFKFITKYLAVCFAVADLESLLEQDGHSQPSLDHLATPRRAPLPLPDGSRSRDHSRFFTLYCEIAKAYRLECVFEERWLFMKEWLCGWIL